MSLFEIRYPSSSSGTGFTDLAIAKFNGTTGTIQNSGITIDANNNIVLPTTTAGATTGILYKGSVRFLHNYRSTGTTGDNIFIGLNSGNLALTGSSGTFSSNNIAIGSNCLLSLTTGSGNVAVGVNAGTLITTGGENFAMGNSSLTKMTTGSSNTAIGSLSARYATGNNNTALGNAALQGVSGSSTHTKCVAVGTNALTAVTTGGSNTASGYASGTAINSGTNNVLYGYQSGDVLTTGGSNIVIGYDIDPTGATVSNELNIGGVIFGINMYSASSTGRIGINQTAPTARFHLPAGATGASLAPMKLTTGSLQTTAEAGAVEYANEQLYFTPVSLRKEIVLREATRTTSAFNKTSDTTLANVTSLVGNAGAGKIYKFKACLHINCGTTGGMKVAMAGTCTATSITFQVLSHAITTGTQAITGGRINALATSVGVAGNDSYYCVIEGVIAVNGAGTLTVQFAQNVSNGTASSVLEHSTFIVENIL